MEINGPLPTPLNPAASLHQLQSLRLGQLIQAVVIRQITSETALLQLINTNTAGAQPATPQPLQLLAETARPLSPGQQLQLEVLRLGEKPLLKVMTPPLAPEPPTREALMQALPRQSGMAPLLANLTWISQQQSGTMALPQPVQVAARELLEKLPSRDKVSTAEGLKQAIRDSGLFTESKLGAAVRTGALPDLGGDIKGLLLRLLGAVQRTQGEVSGAPAEPTRPPLPTIPLPPPLPGTRPQPQGQAEPTLASLDTVLSLLQELGRQSEGGTARTQLHQLASLPSPDQNPVSWSFELPVRNQESVDLFQFIVEEHKGERDQHGEPKQRWSITIAFELEGLGPMHARLQLEDGKVGATFWAGSFDTSALIGQNLGDLAQRFKEAGLESGELRCYQGEPPEAAAAPLPRIVLDVKA